MVNINNLGKYSKPFFYINLFVLIVGIILFSYVIARWEEEFSVLEATISSLMFSVAIYFVSHSALSSIFPEKYNHRKIWGAYFAVTFIIPCLLGVYFCLTGNPNIIDNRGLNVLVWSYIGFATFLTAMFIAASFYFSYNFLRNKYLKAKYAPIVKLNKAKLEALDREPPNFNIIKDGVIFSNANAVIIDKDLELDSELEDTVGCLILYQSTITKKYFAYRFLVTNGEIVDFEFVDWSIKEFDDKDLLKRYEKDMDKYRKLFGEPKIY